MINIGAPPIHGTFQEHDKFAPNMDLTSQLFLVVMVDTEDTQWTSDDGQRQGYGMSSPQVR